MISPSESGPDDDDLISSPTDITARQQQVHLVDLIHVNAFESNLQQNFRKGFLLWLLEIKLPGRFSCFNYQNPQGYAVNQL